MASEAKKNQKILFLFSFESSPKIDVTILKVYKILKTHEIYKLYEETVNAYMYTKVYKNISFKTRLKYKNALK